jgi:cyanophycinase
MITGGESYLALRNGTQVRYDTKELPVSEVLTAYGSGGIGLFTDGLLDTHFANRGRHGRLVELLVDSRGLTTGHHRAIGIDENTALVVTGDWTQRRAAVIGQRGVWLFDTSAARRVSAAAATDKSSSSVGRLLLGLGFDPIEGVRLSRLSDGDRLDLGSFSLHHASYKTAIIPSNDVSVDSSEDIFREDTFEFDKLLLSLLQSMAQSTFGVTKQTNPQLSIRLQKEEGESGSSHSSRGYGGINPTTGLYAYSFESVFMSVDVAE